MWLINTGTLELRSFIGASAVPQYAILSHCWGDDEMIFRDFRKQRKCLGKGYEKIVSCCRFVRESSAVIDKALRYSLDWVWIDTVCIDKTSSAELSEAINSMYQYYRDATVCIAVLEDVTIEYASFGKNYRWSREIDEQFQNCRWFTRGWTLQELTAPRQVIFVNAKWQYIGKRTTDPWELPTVDDTLAKPITKITGIPRDAYANVESYSVAQRLSWASKRTTSRTEDMAYCLLGLFGVNMPLVYGEGPAAFRRLQYEILARHRDESIFAWDLTLSDQPLEHMLAPSPFYFANCDNVMFPPRSARPALSRDGTQWQLTVMPVTASQPHRVFSRAEQNVVGEHSVLVIRLACFVQRADSRDVSLCIMFLQRTECGHLSRTVHPEFFDPFALASAPGLGPLTEGCIGDVREWVPVESPYTALIHESDGDSRACERRLREMAWSDRPSRDQERSMPRIELRLGSSELKDRLTKTSAAPEMSHAHPNVNKT